jgi:poly-gamma-glutamate synthesis protein (capsule biosynthesis protein)
VLVFAYGSASAGVPMEWAARKHRAGVNVLDELAPDAARQVARDVRATKQPGDVVIASIHWGGNWGYDVPREHQELAHRLIDEAGVDLVHGHSSHHPRPIEVYRDKLILYGCGDFLNDYEGIGGHESFRPELSLMYLPEFDPASGRLRYLTLIPTCIRRFRVNRASAMDATWLREMLNREGRPFGTSFELQAEAGGALELRSGA